MGDPAALPVETVPLAIIGSGPAGLAAAWAATVSGVERVIVLDREETAGGVPRHCAHPPYGLREFGRIMTGPAYARRLVVEATEAGVEIRTGVTVVELGRGGRLTVRGPAGVSAIAAQRVVLAMGARETPRSARLIGGDRPLGVLNTGALQASVHLHGLTPFRRPVILGTELVSFSAILTARKAGIRPVAMIEPNASATARWPCPVFPRLLGIPVHYGATIVDLRGGRRVEAVEVALADGRRLTLDCDGLLVTGGFVPAAELVRRSHLAFCPLAGGPAVDQYGRCSDPAYFAAGNLLRPIETAGWSFREGRVVGRLAALDLAGRLAPAAADRVVPVHAGRAVRYAVPQRLALPTPPAELAALPHLPGLQLRVVEPFRGTLTLAMGNRLIWQRLLSVRPERRLIVPLADLDLPAGPVPLTVGF